MRFSMQSDPLSKPLRRSGAASPHGSEVCPLKKKSDGEHDYPDAPRPFGKDCGGSHRILAKVTRDASTSRRCQAWEDRPCHCRYGSRHAQADCTLLHVGTLVPCGSSCACDWRRDYFTLILGWGGSAILGADAEPGVGRLVVARLLKRHLCPVGRIVHECVDATGGHICRCVHA